MHENRETSRVPEQSGRSGKANNHKPDTYAREESDWAEVPVKPLNKEARAALAEVVEGRAQTGRRGHGRRGQRRGQVKDGVKDLWHRE